MARKAATSKALPDPASFPRFAIVAPATAEGSHSVVGFHGDRPPPGSIFWTNVGDRHWTPCAVPRDAKGADKPDGDADRPLFEDAP